MIRGRDVGSEDEVRKRQKIQRQLDEAFADSFPASDPVSIVTSNEEEDWGAAPDPATDHQQTISRQETHPRGDRRSRRSQALRRPALHSQGAVSSRVEPAWFTVVSTIGRRHTFCT